MSQLSSRATRHAGTKNRRGAALLIAALSLGPALSSKAATVTFDFDTGTPPLSTGQSTPLDQTSGGVTAHCSSPTVGAGGFSVQSDATTQYHMSQFSRNYLWPNSVYSPALDIQFSVPLTNITFTFATADFQQVEVPTTIQLTAYENATGTPPVGTATAHGTYASDTMPMGTLTFDSAQPFHVVEILIPWAPQAASGFLVDNVVVTTSTVPTVTTTATGPPTATPISSATSTPTAIPTLTGTPSATPAQTPTPTPIPCVGDCDHSGQVTIDEILLMVNIAFSPPVTMCEAGDANHDLQITVDEILLAVNNALTHCP